MKTENEEVDESSSLEVAIFGAARFKEIIKRIRADKAQIDIKNPNIGLNCGIVKEGIKILSFN